MNESLENQKKCKIGKVPALKVANALFPHLSQLNGKKDILGQAANQEQMSRELLVRGVQNEDYVGNHEEGYEHKSDPLHKHLGL